MRFHIYSPCRVDHKTATTPSIHKLQFYSSWKPAQLYSSVFPFPFALNAAAPAAPASVNAPSTASCLPSVNAADIAMPLVRVTLSQLITK